MVRREEQNGKGGKAGGIEQQEELSGSDEKGVNKICGSEPIQYCFSTCYSTQCSLLLGRDAGDFHNFQVQRKLR